MMKAMTYIEKNYFALLDKPKPELKHPRDAIVKVTLSSICTSDLHIKHGSVPRAVPGITLGHEMVGIVESIGKKFVTFVLETASPSTWKPFAENAFSASTASSITVRILMAAGR